MTRRLSAFISACSVAALLAASGLYFHDQPGAETRAAGARWLADGSAALAVLLASPAQAGEQGAVAPASEFPPPPEVASGAAGALAVAAPLAPGRRSGARKEPLDPTLAPASGEEALARAAIRTAATLAAPGWIAASPAKTGRWAHRVGDDLEAELRCLALNVYWEARSESALGRFAVAAVTLNRVANRAFPDTICDVVRQGEELGLHRCQFSWVCDRRSNEPEHDAAWREAEHVAFSALFLNLPDPTRGALWYHADYVSPPWAGTMAQATRIGRHLFYRGPVRTVEAGRGLTG